MSFDIHHFENIDMDLPDLTGDPSARDIKTIAVPRVDFCQVIDRWLLDDLDAPGDLFERGTTVINLTNDTYEVIGEGADDGRPPIISFPRYESPRGYVHFEAEDLPQPTPGVLLIVDERVLKDLLAMAGTPGARPIDDILYAQELHGHGKGAYTHRVGFLARATVLRLAPYEGSFLGAQLETIMAALQVMHPQCGMRGLTGHLDPFGIDPFDPFGDF